MVRKNIMTEFNSEQSLFKRLQIYMSLKMPLKTLLNIFNNNDNERKLGRKETGTGRKENCCLLF